MIKGWIIYSKETLSNKFNNNAFDWMIAEAYENNLEAVIIFEEDIQIDIISNTMIFKVKNHSIDLPDFVLLRSYSIDIAVAFEKLNIPVFNSTLSLNNCRNKWISHLICSQHKISCPNTIYAKKETVNFSSIVSEIGIPFVLKEIFGAQGEEVYLIESEEMFYSTIIKTQSEIICQKYISEAKGRDIRVHVIGDEAVVAIERIALEGFKSNFSLGGTAKEYILNEELKTLAIKTAQVHGLDIAGIDILLSDNGPLVCEINGISAFRTVAMNTDVNLPNLIFKHIYKKITATNNLLDRNSS